MREKKYPVRMFRCWCFLLLAALFFSWGGVSVRADRQGDVYDDAALLDESEIAELDRLISTVKEQTGWNIYVVTTEDAQGKTAEAYADDFFDSHSPDQEDGAVLLIDMEHREIWLSTCGEAIRYLTDERIDTILDRAFSDISGGNYAACLITMVNGAKNAYDSGIPENQYNYDRDTGEISVYRHITVTEALIAVVLAVVAGVLVFFGIVGKYRIKFENYTYNPREFSRMTLRHREDHLINSHTMQRRIQTSSGSSTHHSSGGRSTTHRSSSGRSHGGGGRRF